MFTFFNKKSLYIGTDSQRFNQILDTLATNNIKYKYKLRDQFARMGGSTVRGSFGDQGTSYEYEIFVLKKDYEQVVNLIS